MCQNPSDPASETYKLKIFTFKHGQTEELLQLMKNVKRSVDDTGTTTRVGKINYPRTMLHGEAIRDFDELSCQDAGTKNTHLKFIQESLLVYFPRLMTFPSRSSRCAALCVNIETPLSRASPPTSMN